MIQYGVHFDPPEGDDSRRKPRVQSTGRGFESCSLQQPVCLSPTLPISTRKSGSQKTRRWRERIRTLGPPAAVGSVSRHPLGLPARDSASERAAWFISLSFRAASCSACHSMDPTAQLVFGELRFEFLLRFRLLAQVLGFIGKHLGKKLEPLPFFPNLGKYFASASC